MSDKLAVVGGGGGFIGGHLVGELLRRGDCRVRAVDIKPLEQWYQVHEAAENVRADLKELPNCRAAWSPWVSACWLRLDLASQ